MTAIQFGGQTLQINVGENTRAAQRAAAAALISEGIATNAAAAFTFEIGVIDVKSALSVEGMHFADPAIDYDFTGDEFIGQVLVGSGTIDAIYYKDGVEFYGPVTLSSTPTNITGLSLAAAKGSQITCLYERKVGTVSAVYCKITGGPTA